MNSKILNLAIVVILAALAAVVFGRARSAGRLAGTTNNLRQLQAANAAFATEQGLQALVEKSSLDPEPRNFKEGGYLPELPIDQWGRPYL